MILEVRMFIRKVYMDVILINLKLYTKTFFGWPKGINSALIRVNETFRLNTQQQC